jgi:glycosyltransferase involved in cell wall biosynthesis
MAGISFLLRCRNEEATLQQSLESLKPLTIEHEIILVLHLCTDRSAEIATIAAANNPNIKIFTYDVELSRAGYQTLATDSGSPHSIMTYYNWCRAKATKPWIFKWDADFVASPGLITYLNSREWNPEKTTRIVIHAKDETSKNWESYLSCGLAGYGKYIFWEVPLFFPPTTSISLDPEQYIDHVSKLSNIKGYWKAAKPWFETEVSEEAVRVKERYDRLVAEFGPEPEGMARASNPACDSPFLRIKAANPDYVNFTA